MKKLFFVILTTLNFSYSLAADAASRLILSVHEAPKPNLPHSDSLDCLDLLSEMCNGSIYEAWSNLYDNLPLERLNNIITELEKSLGYYKQENLHELVSLTNKKIVYLKKLAEKYSPLALLEDALLEDDDRT